MFETHDDLPDILTDDAQLWRYVDLARFADLLQTRELHMARADQMVDAWEGSYSEANVSLRPSVYGDQWQMMKNVSTTAEI